MLSRLRGGRRAEAFQNAIDGHVEPNNHEVADLVDLACSVRTMSSASLDTDTRTAIRARLVAEAEATWGGSAAPQQAATPPRRHRKLRTTVGAAVVATALSGGLVSVSANALPGDTLYPIKRGFERIELTLNRGATASGSTQLEQASARLAEAETLARQGNTGQVGAVLSDFADAANTGAEDLMRVHAEDGDSSSIVTLRTFTNASAGRLRSLATMIDESSMPAYSSAVSTVTAIDRRALEACPGCTSSPLVEIAPAEEPSPDDTITLPEFDLRLGDEAELMPNRVLTEPNLMPRDSRPLPNRDTGPTKERDYTPRDEPELNPRNDDFNDSDQGPRGNREDGGLDSEKDGDREESRFDRKDRDNDRGGKDRGNVLPGLPEIDLPPKDGSKNQRRLPLEIPIEPLDNALSPVRDLLSPLLGDQKKKRKGDDSENGGLNGLLGPLLGEDSSPNQNNDSDGDSGPLGILEPEVDTENDSSEQDEQQQLEPESTEQDRSTDESTPEESGPTEDDPSTPPDDGQTEDNDDGLDPRTETDEKQDDDGLGLDPTRDSEKNESGLG